MIFVENGKVGNKIKVEINEVADRFEKAKLHRLHLLRCFNLMDYRSELFLF